LSEDVTKVDHYRALDLKPDANPGEIKEAWEKIQNRFDAEKPVTHLRDMTAHLERIVERGRAAYEVLSHFRARDRYDEILRSLAKDRKPIEDAEKAAIDAKARKTLVEANLKRANELIKEDELYLAIQLLEQACALEPRPEELIKLSRLLQRNPLWVNRALACMRRAIEADPRNVGAWLELADFWRRRNHAERQRKSLERALAIEPENEQANNMYKDLVGSRELQRLLRRARQMR
jgi:curved DNA-binding protein CbpA